MAMYALALVPLIKEAQKQCKQVWFADDATGCDKLSRLLSWFTLLCELGPCYGYFINPKKCILVAKPSCAAEAKILFESTGVEVCSDGAKDTGCETITEGARHLGAAVGSPAFKSLFVENKVRVWVQQVKELSEVAATEPHAAFAVFTHCLQGRWTFLARSMPNLSSLFQPLEEAIHRVFLSSLLKRDITRLERDIISLPARFGGLGIFNPAIDCDRAHKDSLVLSEPLVTLVERQDGVLET
jgi:hypothetical protein